MPPVTAKPFSESRKHRQVARHGVVLVVTLYHPLHPRSDERDGLMHHPAQLLLNQSELRPHPLRRRMPPDHKPAGRVRATEVREPEERECFRLSLPSLPSTGRGKAPEFDQSRFLRMNLQSELCQPLLKVSQKSFGVRPVLKSDDEIVGVANYNHVALRDFLSPYLDPEVEYIVQVHVGQQW